MATPTLVSWNLTRRCNLACGHCYLDAVQRRSECGDELDDAEAKSLIAEIAALAPGAMLVLTGGEPLLRRDLPELVATAARTGLMPVIGTNGILLDAAAARQLREAGAMGVGISVDSATSGFHDRLRGQQGAWEGALRGVGAAREAGLAVLLQTTLFDDNRDEMPAIARLAEDIGAMALNFFFLVCTGRGVTQTDLSGEAYEAALAGILALQEAHPKLMLRARCAPYARRMLRLRAGQTAGNYGAQSSACLAGRSYLRIAPHGAVTPCPYIPRAAGNVRETALREMWERGEDFVRLRGEMPQGKCGRCDYRVSCGGCRARALATAGDLFAEDGKCGYQPADEAVPEPWPVAAAHVIWTPDARRMLERLPGFVRERVRSSLEQKALAAGEHTVTLQFMHAHRPASLPFFRPSS